LNRLWILFLAGFVLASGAYAGELSVRSELCQDLYDNRTQFACRVSILRALTSRLYEKEVTFTPYVEGTYEFDLDLDSVSKVEAGLTAEMRFLKYLHASLSGQYVSVSGETSLVEQYVSTNSDGNDVELIGQIGFRLPLPLKILEFSGAETYVFEVEGMRGTRNELTAALEVGLLPFDLGLRWRHLDTIHGPDTDELALTFKLAF
jgi:hypothetical protein